MKTYYENPLLSNNILEEKMIREIIKYIEELLSLVKPTTLVYLAIDGVAPVAKIKHQRQRRFKSVKEHEIKENIARKHNHEYQRPWNNSAITPGTIFMSKVTKALLHYLQLKPKNQIQIKYIFSSCQTPGEGEHKILQYIRNNNQINNKLIYGLDADLIYLALASEKNNIYLLRESSQINQKEKNSFNIISIDVMKECIYQEIGIECDKTKAMRDYIFLGFFLGNDFLPSIPSINFRSFKESLNGLNIIVRIYGMVFEEMKEYIINIENRNIEINFNFLKRFFQLALEEEEGYFNQMYQQKNYIHPCESTNPYDIEIYRLENLMFKVEDPIGLGKPGINFNESKEKYYQYHQIDINEAIKEYIDGLYWVSYYYFDKSPNQLWSYKYDHAPFASDIYEYICREKIIKPKFEDKINIMPIEQLLMVLPPQSKYLLPYKYQQLMNDNSIREYYPLKFELDLLMKKKFWQAMPIIPMINVKLIKEKTKYINLSMEENKRNEIKKPFEIYI